METLFKSIEDLMIRDGMDPKRARTIVRYIRSAEAFRLAAELQKAGGDAQDAASRVEAIFRSSFTSQLVVQAGALLPSPNQVMPELQENVIDLQNMFHQQESVERIQASAKALAKLLGGILSKPGSAK
jgi:hypothetical protein